MEVCMDLESGHLCVQWRHVYAKVYPQLTDAFLDACEVSDLEKDLLNEGYSITINLPVNLALYYGERITPVQAAVPFGKNVSTETQMKPIAHFVASPAIETLCLNYGSYLENLSTPDRLALAKGLTECLLYTVGYHQDCKLLEFCKGDGHVFGNGMVQKQIHIEGIIEALDQELTLKEAAQLAIGILENTSVQ